MNRRLYIVPSLIIIAGMVAVSGWAWGKLPADAMLPVHWGLDGTADNYAPKPVALLFLPVIAVVALAASAVIPRLEPRRLDLERSGQAWGAAWIGIVVLLAFVHVAAVASGLGATVDVATLAIGAAGGLFVVIGNYMGKVRRNHTMGIRTPWTLSSDRSWNRTQRLGGRLLVLLGLLIVILALVGTNVTWLFGILIGGILGLTALVVGYSYIVWRDDPDRRTADNRR